MIQFETSLNVALRANRLLPVQFVHLREGKNCGYIILPEPFNEPHVPLIGFSATVKQDHDGTQSRRILQITFNHRGPGIGHSMGNAGIAVTRQVDEIEVAIYDEKIDQLGLARDLARLHKAFSVKQGIDNR